MLYALLLLTHIALYAPTPSINHLPVLEVLSRSHCEWEQAILAGYRVWRLMREIVAAFSSVICSVLPSTFTVDEKRAVERVQLRHAVGSAGRPVSRFRVRV